MAEQRKKVLISRTSKTPFLSFENTSFSQKNKLSKGKHKQPMVNPLQHNTALKVIYTRVKQLYYPSIILSVSNNYNLSKDQ